MKNYSKNAEFWKALINSRQGVKKKNFVSSIFRSFVQDPKSGYLDDTLKKFTSRAATEGSSFSEAFINYYKKNPENLQNDLKNHSAEYINFENFNKEIGNSLNSESELPEYLFNSICELLHLR